MKLTKSDLKAILKECLLELIEEGVFESSMKFSKEESLKNKNKSNLKEENNIFKNQIEARKFAQMIAGNSTEDEISSLSRTNTVAESVNNERVKSLALEMAKGDKAKANLYATIFADTAINTLPNQLVNDVNSGGMPSAVSSMNESVSDKKIKELAVNGDSMRWAKIAFATKKSP